MVLEYYKVDPNYKKERQIVCPHNDGVLCEVKNCINCGWHPAVAKYRLENIRKELNRENERKAD